MLAVKDVEDVVVYGGVDEFCESLSAGCGWVSVVARILEVDCLVGLVDLECWGPGHEVDDVGKEIAIRSVIMWEV